jgi:tetratricopeptide (TPR) repeat protein
MRYIERALAGAKALGAKREEGASTYVLGVILRGMGRNEAATATFNSARSILTDVGDTSLLAMIDYDEGLLRASEGRHEAARSLLDRARKSFREIGMGLWLQKTERAIADLGSGNEST